jgi:hypothetical protein
VRVFFIGGISLGVSLNRYSLHGSRPKHFFYPSVRSVRRYIYFINFRNGLRVGRPKYPFENSHSPLYRSVGLPSFLINYFGQKRIGKRLFLAENGSIKKIFQAKRGPNRPKTG